MKNLFCAAVFCVTTVAIAAGAGAQANTEQPDNGYTEADAGALGVEATVDANVYCAADAGTLGHPDPVTACN